MNTSLNKGIKNNGIISDENIKIKGEKLKISKISKNKRKKRKKDKNLISIKTSMFDGGSITLE